MMGRVILQSEGHLGVLCWDRFNASIEARRLPRGWHFVDLALREERAKKSRAMGMAPPQQPPQEEDGAEADGSPVTGQMHSTGYWADELDGGKGGTSSSASSRMRWARLASSRGSASRAPCWTTRREKC